MLNDLFFQDDYREELSFEITKQVMRKKGITVIEVFWIFAIRIGELYSSVLKSAKK